MQHTGYEQLLITREGPVLRVALNAPDKLNAIDFTMECELLRLFQDLRRDRTTAVVVLTGAGRAFSAGGDLQHNLRLMGDLPMIKQEFDLARHFVNALLTSSSRSSRASTAMRSAWARRSRCCATSR